MRNSFEFLRGKENNEKGFKYQTGENSDGGKLVSTYR